MVRWVRWSVTLVVAGVVFGVCLWVGRSVAFGWMPRAEADRWVVATAFATVMGTVAAAAVGWWAGREPAPAPLTPTTVSQEVTASGRARVNQVGGDQNVSSSPSPAGAGGVRGRVEQNANASDDASVTQVGGNQYTGPGDDEQQW